MAAGSITAFTVLMILGFMTSGEISIVCISVMYALQSAAVAMMNSPATALAF